MRRLLYGCGEFPSVTSSLYSGSAPVALPAASIPYAYVAFVINLAF